MTNKSHFSVEKMCKVLTISRNSYYHWLNNRDKNNVNKQLLQNKIKAIYDKNLGIYGSPRITVELSKMGYNYSSSWISKLMKDMNLRSILKRKFVVTTDSKHGYSVSDHLLERDFNTDKKGKVWVSDITYIKTGSKWSYLTSIIDLYDRKVVGWIVSDNLTAKHTSVIAWKKAVNNRLLSKGFIFHSDRGIQYSCNEFREVLNSHKNVKQSMSRKANCWDNAVAESFFKTIKYEWLNRFHFQNIQQVDKAVDKYINWYNNIRIHSSIGYLSPNEKSLEVYKNKYTNVA